MADLTAVWLVSRMQEQVVLQIGLFAEATVANVTLEGPGARVDVGVRFQVAWGWERFGAHGAFVRFFLKQKRHIESNCLLFKKCQDKKLKIYRNFL